MEEVALCPACAKRDIDTPSGFCAECAVERIRERYSATQAEKARARIADWMGRTEAASSSQADWDRDRQRVSRLKRAVRPREPAAISDPWELAYEALQEVSVLRRAIGVRVKASTLARFDGVEEALRRLAWGPTDDAVKPAPRRSVHSSTVAATEPEDLSASRALARLPKEPEQDFAGWNGSWRHVG